MTGREAAEEAWHLESSIVSLFVAARNKFQTVQAVDESVFSWNCKTIISRVFCVSPQQNPTRCRGDLRRHSSRLDGGGLLLFDRWMTADLISVNYGAARQRKRREGKKKTENLKVKKM